MYNRADRIGIYTNYTCTITDYMFNFEIRVGEDGAEISNNKLCFKHIGNISSANFTCSPDLYGNWVSINKSSTYHGTLERMVLYELRVFSEYSKLN